MTLSRQTIQTLPLVAIVGRPNVGKSTLFNRFTQSRRAIIDPNPGMTRDRLYSVVETEGRPFRLVDTGGVDQGGALEAAISHQSALAMEQADVILFMLNGREGLLPGDLEIAQMLRRLNKPTVVFINKLDGGKEMPFDTDLFTLGLQPILTGSAKQKDGLAKLLEVVQSLLPEAPALEEPPESDDPDGLLRLAIIGRPNVGKSSLVNRLLQEDRVMVSPMAGTTRDPIDTYLSFEEEPYCLVDTAGIRKAGRIEGSQEHISVLMAKKQVAQADIIAVVIDATEAEAVQDAAIAGIAADSYKPIIVVVNKWDAIVEKHTHSTLEFQDRISRRLKFLSGAPFIFVSALSGQRVYGILKHARTLWRKQRNRLTTAALNRFAHALSDDKQLPSYRKRRLKIYYITQVDQSPLTFVIACNAIGPPHFSQSRFLTNRLREAFELDGIPFKLIFKGREPS
jgi:GTP-binding protein